MNVKEAIYTRRSVRNYTEQPVDRATIEQLIEAASKAPSAVNSQPWAFGVIQDKGLMKSIAKRSEEHLRKQLGDDNMPPYFQDPEFNVFYNAPALILVLNRGRGPCPPTDCSLAVQNLLLMAHEMGLATCWIGLSYGFLNTPEAKAELGIPEEYGVAAPIILGYPQPDQPLREKEEPEVVFWK